MFRCGKTLMAFALMVAMPVAVSAQTSDNPPAAGSPAQPAGQPQPSAELLKPAQLEALVAPIALYPDELLANVLAASTYPLEVVQADRWLKERKALKGDALKKEVDKQSWDDSVKALASTPDVISMMSDKVDWTKSSWRCRARAAAGCDGRDPASSFQGLRQQEAGHHKATEGQRSDTREQAGHRHRVG